MPKFAYVTLLLNSEYLPGTLTLVQSLRQSGSEIPIILLISKQNVNEQAYELINQSGFFDRLIDVDSYLFESKNRFELDDLLKRSDLSLTLTKLNVWRLTDYERLVYLDSDILIHQNIDHLFETWPGLTGRDIIASSDSGWPDIFNSGLFVLKPNLEVFNELMEFYNENNSFDGADQGLLNEYFNLQSDKTHASWLRLPFTFNCTLNSNYEYLPAMIRFKDSIKVFHFIGLNKPWKNHSLCYDTNYAKVFNNNNENLFQLWWNVFESIDIGDFTCIEILEISNNLQSKFSTLTLSTPSYKKQVPVIEHHTPTKISNPFLSPTKESTSSTFDKNTLFPTFYYKKPTTSEIKDESKQGEAYKMTEGKFEWPNNKKQLSTPTPKKSKPQVKLVKETIERAFKSHLDKYVHDNPIFPWESKQHKVTRSFANTVEFEPPTYSISVMSGDDEIKSIIGECKDDNNLLGFSDGQKFEEYLNQVEKISSSSSSTTSSSVTRSPTNSVEPEDSEI